MDPASIPPQVPVQANEKKEGRREEQLVFVENTRDFGFLPIPHHLRYHPERPFNFSLGLNIAFGFASTFSLSILPRYNSILNTDTR